MSIRLKSIIFLALSAIMMSFGGLLLKRMKLEPLAVAGIRAAFAALTLLAFLGKPNFTWSWLQIGGALCYAATVIQYVISNRLTTAANAIMLQYTCVIYIVVMAAWLLKEKIRPADWITVAAVIIGMVFFFIDDYAPGKLLGNILAAGSGLTFAGCVIFMRVQKQGSPMESILLGNIAAALVCLPFIVRSSPDFDSIVCLGALGIFQIGIPFILYSLAIRHATALEIAAIPLIEPVLNPVWVFLANGEAPGIAAVTGGIIILGSVAARCAVSVKITVER